MIKRIILIIILGVLTASCSCVPVPEPEPNNSNLIGITPIRLQTGSDNYLVRVKFTEEHPEFDEVVQELYRYNSKGKLTAVLVEKFDTSNDGTFDVYIYDRQYASGKTHEVRHLFIYPAKTVGVDERSNGFGQLPENRDGSVITDIPEKFNESYQKHHETIGVIVDDDRDNGVWWKIEFNHGKLTVTMPDNTTMTIGKLYKGDYNAKD